jgi:hypothetical protein
VANDLTLYVGAGAGMANGSSGAKQNQIVLILAQKQVELLNAKNEQEATNLQAEIDSLQQDLHQKK